MYRIYLDHGGAYGNLGDEAMLMNAVRRIRQRLGEVEFIVPREHGAPLPSIGDHVSIVPPGRSVGTLARRMIPVTRWRNFLDRTGLNPFPRLVMEMGMGSRGRGVWRALVGVLQDCDGVYCVGAANINDLARYGCLLPKCMLIEQAHRVGIPVIVSSQTIGPLEFPWTQRAVVRAVHHSDFFSLRDGGVSEQLLVSLGVNADQLVWVGDEAFSLPPAPRHRVEQYLTEQGVDVTRPFALFHLRATDYTQCTARYYPKIAEALDQLDLRTQILFVPMSYWKHSGQDEECGLAIRSLMRGPGKLYVLHSLRDARMVRGLVDMASWVTALSYHLQVFALAAACPMAVISSGSYYQVKAKGMQMMIGPQVPIIRLRQTTVSELIAAMRRLEKEQERCVSALQKARSRVEQANDAPVEALARILAGKGHRV